MYRVFSICLILFLSVDLGASIWQVGPTQTYSTPNELYLADNNGAISISTGDTIEIDAALYEGNDCLAVWHADSLLIRGVDGIPHMKANGSYIWQKAIWVATGDNIIVEHIEFSEAAVPDMNGAGIRLDGTGLTVRYCYFHDNENGILTSNPYAGNVRVENSEFNHNGYGDGYSHNIYVGHVDTFTLQFCYMHHAFIGHNVKSRAATNFVLYNRIMDEESGQSSMLLDLPNGGFSLIIGNLFMQGENAENKSLITYGTEGLSNPVDELYVVNNTMVNERHTATFINAQNSPSIAKAINNLMIGIGDPWLGVTDSLGNYYSLDTNGIGFIDLNNYDYHLSGNSVLINQGSNPGSAGMYDLIPQFEYYHSSAGFPRSIVDAIDIGAYEYPTQLAMQESIPATIKIYPNPAKGYIIFDGIETPDHALVLFYDSSGRQLTCHYTSDRIPVSHLSQGIYLAEVIVEGKIYRSRFVKN
jgi:hypothetical protein